MFHFILSNFVYLKRCVQHLRAINIKCLTICVLEVDSTKNMSKATRTIKHGARFSRKLQKRLTRRTLAEARALKEQGTECIHVVLYIVELVRLDIYHLLFITHHTQLSKYQGLHKMYIHLVLLIIIVSRYCDKISF